MLNVYFDGAIKDGECAAGVVIMNDDATETLFEQAYYCGPAPEGEDSSTLAEYRALKNALIELENWYGNVACDGVHFFNDSKICVNQMSGTWKVKAEGLKACWSDCMNRILRMRNNKLKVDFTWIPREQNARADVRSKQGRVLGEVANDPQALALGCWELAMLKYEQLLNDLKAEPKLGKIEPLVAQWDAMVTAYGVLKASL